MKMNIKRIGVGLSIVIVLGLVLIGLDWNTIKLKNGYSKPLSLTVDQYSEKPILVKLPLHKLDTLKVSLTDMYYFPESKQLQYGLWFKKWSHNQDDIPDRVFDISFIDDTGRVYSNDTVTRTFGIFDEFQFRANREIPLNQTTKLKMIITSVKEKDNVFTPIKKEEIEFVINL